MTAAQLELITAAVDGELSAPERRAVRTLLASSPEAKELFTKLRSDKARIRALPPVAPPADLRTKILAKLAAVTPAPSAKPKVPSEPARNSPPVPKRRELWVPLAVAASVFLCLAAGALTFFRNGGTQPPVAQNNWAHVLPSHEEEPPAAVPSPVRVPDPSAAVRVGVMPVPPVPTPREVLPAPTAVAVAPLPRELNPDLTGFPVRPVLPPFQRIEIRVPFLRAVSDLGREDVGHELLETIDRDQGITPVRFDLFVRDTARGVEVLQKAAKASGVAVHADATTLERLKKKQVYSVVVYTEALTGEELVALFAKLEGEDAKYSPRVGDSLHATPIVRTDELELKAVLGTDVGLYKRPAPSQNHKAGQGGRVPSGKPLSAGTIDQVVQSVSGSPGTASSQPAKPTDKTDKHAVLLTWQTTHPHLSRTNPMASAELKQYFQKRGDRKPHAVPAIIVIRPAR